MAVALRVLVLLAATIPLFAATAFRPTWWQILIAAAIGSALGQLAVRATQGRRGAGVVLMAVAGLVAAGAVGWSFAHAAGREAPSGPAFLVARSSVTWDDVRAIQAELPPAAPYLHKGVQLSSEGENWATQVVGTTPAYFDIRALRVRAGRRFEEAEPDKVVVLGETTAAELFGGNASPVGSTVRIGNTPFTIIGVLAHQGMSPEGLDYDDVALVPIDIYTARIAVDSRRRFVGAVFLSATSDRAASLRRLLRERHRLGPGDDDDFVIISSNPDPDARP